MSSRKLLKLHVLSTGEEIYLHPDEIGVVMSLDKRKGTVIYRTIDDYAADSDNALTVAESKEEIYEQFMDSHQ